MVAVKHHQADSFLKAPDPAIGAVLFYGPDAGLVAERASTLARNLSKRENPPGEILQFEDADLESDPDRIAVELQTLPMFGGRKIIRARAGRRIASAQLKPLIEGGPLAGFLIIEAGNLRGEEGLRGLFEKSPRCAAVACYADSEEDLANLARQVLKSHGLSISSDTLDHLVGRLGADRGTSRSEVEKLALYALGRGEVTGDDIDAVVGEASDLQLESIAEAAASGNGAKAVFDADRAVASGEGAQAVLLAVQRYFLRLHKVRAAIDQGRSVDDALRQMRPPLPTKARAALSGQCRTWTVARLSVANAEIQGAIKASRQTGALDELLAERLLLRLAFMAGVKR